VQTVHCDSFIATVDLSKAYYQLKVAEHHQKFLRIRWQGRCWVRFTAKLQRPIIERLARRGHSMAIYIDDAGCYGAELSACQKAWNAWREA